MKAAQDEDNSWLHQGGYIAFFEYQIWTESTTLKVEKKLLAEITDLKQLLEDMNSDIVATEADPEQVAEKEQAASQAETDANLAKQAAVSKKKAALREATAAEEQQKFAVKPWSTKLRSRLRFVSRRNPRGAGDETLE